MTRRARKGVPLLLSLLMALSVAVQVAAYGERVYNSNSQYDTGFSYSIFTGRRVAQSFTPTESFILENVTLYLQNLGTSQADTLNVTIQPDVLGIPSDVVLAGSDRARAGTSWLDFPLSPRPTLIAGLTYWIVAESAQNNGEGYTWFRTANRDVVPGISERELGSGWTQVDNSDLTYFTFGLRLEAKMVVGLSVNRATADPGDTFSYTVYVNNTGSRAAAEAWVNLTLSADVTYGSDTATSIGGTMTGPSNWTIPNLVNGPHSFTVTVSVNAGTPVGRLLMATVHLDFTDSLGASQLESSATASTIVGLRAKPMYLAFDGVADRSDRLAAAPPTGTLQDFDGDGSPGLTVAAGTTLATAPTWSLLPVLARPLHLRGDLTVTLYLDSRVPSDTVRLNVTLLDRDVTVTPIVARSNVISFNAFTDWEPFVFDLGTMDYWTPAGHAIGLAVFNEAGNDAYVAYAAPSVPSRIVASTDTYISLDSVSVEDARGPAAVFSTRDTVRIIANVSDPFGIGEIVGATIDVTDPDGLPIASGLPLVVTATDGSSRPAWKVFTYSLTGPSKEGTYTFVLTATEGNGVRTRAPGSFLVRVPILILRASSNSSYAHPLDPITFAIGLNNTGRGDGRAWLNVSIPAGLAYVSDDAAGNGGIRTGPSNWTFPSLPPGPHGFNLSIRVDRDVPGSTTLTTRCVLAYADEKAFLWSAVAVSVPVAVGGPRLYADLAVDKAALRRNETLTVTTAFNNTGDDVAGTAWINVTLPANLVYGNDNASSLPEFTGRNTSAATLRFTFAGLAPGPHAFAIYANGSTALQPGDPIAISVTEDYALGGGQVIVRSTASASSVGSGPILVAAVGGASLANPGDSVSMTIAYNNTGTEAAVSTWVNLTLDPRITISSAIPPPVGVSPGFVVWYLPSVPLGSHAITFTASMPAGLPDGQQLAFRAALDYGDTSGSNYTVPEVSHTVRITAPLFALAIASDATPVEGGDVVTFTVSFNNGGSGTASRTWVNLTLPDTMRFQDDDAPVAEVVLGAVRSWRFSSVGPGPRAFHVNATVSLAANDGESLRTAVGFNATDANGNPLTPRASSFTQVVSTAKVTVEMTPPKVRTLVGATVTYSVYLNNTGGRAAANVWLNDTLDPRLEFVQDTSGLPLVRRGSTLSWIRQQLAASERVVFEVTLRIAGGSPGDLVSNSLQAEYTNARGVRIGVHKSLEVTVEVAPVPGGLFTNPLFFVALAVALAVPPLGYRYWRSRRHTIEEVFLISREGLLLYHLGRRLGAHEDKDPDLMSAMLTALQEFVRDSFRYQQNRELSMMEFGDYNVIIERGKHISLAATFTGNGEAELRKKLRRVIDDVESKFAEVLEDWNGDMGGVLGIRDIVSRLVPHA